MSPDTLATTHAVVEEAWRTRMLHDPSYLYSVKPRGESLLAKLMSAIVDWLSNLGNTQFDGVADIIGFVLIVGLIILIVYLISRSRKQGIFESSGRSMAVASEIDLEAAPDLDRLIGMAVNDGNYRLAVRLLYRRTLAEMRDGQLIVYRPEKTDAEYAYELRSAAIAKAFRTAVAHFHRAWYGMEVVEQAQYQQVLVAFNDVRSLLGAKQ